MEQSPSRTASARHQTGGISTATENVFFYMRRRRLVTFVFERPINIRLLLLLHMSNQVRILGDGITVISGINSCINEMHFYACGKSTCFIYKRRVSS